MDPAGSSRVRGEMTNRLFSSVRKGVLFVFLLGASCPLRVEADGGNSPPAVFALIIGETAPPDKETLPLRFADDDAFATYGLMVQLASPNHVILLADPDAETRALYPDVQALSPTTAAVRNATARLNRGMKEARNRGNRPVFYFFYTGHGDVKNNEGYVTIADGRFSRTDLLNLIEASEADVNHVIIDACKSYYMVQRRGKGSRRPISGRLPTQKGALPKRTGFFLSTSSDEDSHEWEVFQGGIFSHEMRSALRGAADLDGDFAVTYEEAAAFIRRANASIPEERFRPHFFARPPDNAPSETAILTDFKHADGTRLSLKTEPSVHQYIENGVASRLLDLHPAAGKPVTVLVPKQRPLFVRYPTLGAEISVPKGDVVNIDPLELSSRPVASRGAEHEAFARLFALPFDSSAVREYRLWKMQADAARDAPFSPKGDWVRRSLAIGGAVLLGVGAAMTGVGIFANRSLDASSSGYEIQQANERIRATDVAAFTCYASGGVTLASYLIWTVRRRHRESRRAPSLRATLDPPKKEIFIGASLFGAFMGGAF